MTSLAVLASALMSAPAPSAYDTTHLIEAFDSVTGFATEMVKATDLGYDSGLSIAAAFLNANKSATFTKTLTAGATYAFLASGDDDAEDVDIKVTDASGRVVAEDTDIDNYAADSFTAEKAGAYKFTITLASATPSCVGCILLSDNGWSIPVANLAVPMADLVDTVDGLSEETPVSFVKTANTFCLYGAVVEAEKTFTMTGLSLSGKQPTVVGACDVNSDDIDLSVFNSANELVGIDEADDDFPVVTLERALSGAKVTLTNAGADASVSIFGLLSAD
jgi:hypothetical protein